MQQRSPEQKEAVRILKQEKTETTLWECVVAYQNYLFHTASGLPFQYTIKIGKNGSLNREVLIDRRTDSKSLTWSTFKTAFGKVAGYETVPLIERPKALGDIRGVSYIYPMFYQFGLIDVPDRSRNRMENGDFL